jgi:uncharacterized protein YeaO (DUF488 family)
MLRLKSLKEPTNPEDGLRILIARYRPRYLPKDKESWDQGGRIWLRAKRSLENLLKTRP